MRAHLLAASLTASLGLVSVAVPAFAQIGAGESAPSSAVPPDTSSSPPPPTEGQSRALLHYERGRSYYAAGRYRSAISELETAIRLDPAGWNLYFDLGLVYERVGDANQALISYRHYLEHVTDPAERERADRIVSRVQGARVELEDMHSRPGRADAWFWGFTAASAASLVTGGIVLAAALREPMAPGAPTLNIVADTGLILGGGLAITAVALYFARDALPRYAPRCMSANVGPGGGHIDVGFVF